MTQGARAFDIQRFDLNALPESARLNEWREAQGRAILRLDVEPVQNTPFRSKMTLAALPGFAFGAVATSACQVARTPELIKDCRDDVGLVALVEGTATVSLMGREVSIKGGEAVFLRNSEVGSVRFLSEARYFNFAIPEKPLASLVRDVDAACMTVIPAGSDALRLALRYAGLLLDGDLLATETQRAVAGHFHDLAAMMIGNAVMERSGVRAARLKAIKADIIRNLGSHDLSIATVAARQGITPRYVSKLFEGEGTTFSAFVLNQRLDRAHQMLGNPCLAHKAISAIAFDNGFGDISHFNHSFRRRFGATPSDAREAGQEQNG